MRRKPLQRGQREGRGLAGAGLRAGHKIPPREYEGYRLFLNRAGLLVSQFLDGLEQRRNQSEIFEA